MSDAPWRDELLEAIEDAMHAGPDGILDSIITCIGELTDRDLVRPFHSWNILYHRDLARLAGCSEKNNE